MPSPLPQSSTSPPSEAQLHLSPTSSSSNPTFNLPPSISLDALDILPILTSILTRLQNPSTTNNATQSTSGSPPAPSSNQPQNTPSIEPNETAPLTIKDIPPATDSLKHKLHKVRLQVRELPDMRRSVEEQEVEIGELEARIEEQRRVLEGLRNMARGMKGGNGEVEGERKMEGMET